jgi:tetratricopeptide (TPR) repeat protein
MRPLRASALLVLAGLLAAPHAAPAQSIDRARQLFQGARYAEAKAELMALQRANAADAEVAYYLGRIATVENDAEEAIRQFERAVELEDGNALYHYWLGSAVRELTPHVSKFKMPFYARRLKKAFDRAVALDANQIDARFGLVQFYASAPNGLGGNRNRARQEAAEIAKRSPLRGAIARGFIAEMEENPTAEEVAYQEAIAASPDSISGYRALTETYARQGKTAQAFATIECYAQRRPDDRAALYHVGRIAEMTGQQMERGESALKQFLEVPPTGAHVAMIADAHYHVGRIAERRGTKVVAREHYGAALKLDPRSPARKALGALG